MNTSRLDLMMKMLLVKLLGVLQFAVIVSSASRVICPTQPIEAEEGDDVTLACQLDPASNLSPFTVDWKRVDLNKVVYSYRNKQHHHSAQMDRYRNRATFNLDGLSRGDLTLQLSSVQLSDSGPYRCFVPKLMVSCFINVTVVKKNQQNRTKTGGDAGTTKPLVEDVTKSDDPDAAKTRTVSAIICPIGLFVIAVIVVLVRIGKTENWTKRLRRCREQEEADEANIAEIENLKNQTKAAAEDEELNNIV